MENNNNQNENVQSPAAETEVPYNTGKGILIALIAAIAACGGWILIIRFVGFGLGGAVGGILAAGCGMLVASGYKAIGKPGAVGILVSAVFTFIAAAIATYVGTGIVLHSVGIGGGTFDALYLLFEERIPGVPSSLFWQDFFVMVGIAVVAAIVFSFGGKKKKSTEQSA